MSGLRLTALAVCIIAVLTLSGCFGGGGGGSASTGSYYAGGGSYSGGSSSTGGGSSSTGGGSTISTVHNPEPATVVLFGSGLIAYALFKIKKRK